MDSTKPSQTLCNQCLNTNKSAEKKNTGFYQISTLQALIMGYTKKVVVVDDFLKNADTGLGTFENVNGEMIVIDGQCFKAKDDGSVEEAAGTEGIPFACGAFLDRKSSFQLENIPDLQALETKLNLKIEEDFGLNSMHLIRVDGFFSSVNARSEAALKSQHLTLKEILKDTQKEFVFKNIEGSLVCLYFPDYMAGMNAAGWHFHFISKDRTKGGHVFGFSMPNGTVFLNKLDSIEIKIPTDPAYDTYDLSVSTQDDIKSVEQGK